MNISKDQVFPVSLLEYPAHIVCAFAGLMRPGLLLQSFHEYLNLTIEGSVSNPGLVLTVVVVVVANLGAHCVILYTLSVSPFLISSSTSVRLTIGRSALIFSRSSRHVNSSPTLPWVLPTPPAVIGPFLDISYSSL